VNEVFLLEPIQNIQLAGLPGFALALFEYISTVAQLLNRKRDLLNTCVVDESRDEVFL
jgi:hypothetical protein